jgi:DNA-binding transcriptional ArsR family regulator
MRDLYHPPIQCLELTQVLHALSDPIRLCIVRQLAGRGELPCGTFCENAPKSTMSHHFKVLRLAGVIHQRNEGTSCINTLRCEDLEVRFPGLLNAILQADSFESAVLAQDLQAGLEL